MKTLFIFLVWGLPASAIAQQQIDSVWLRMEAIPVSRDGLHHLMDNFWHKPIGTPILEHDTLRLKSPIHYFRVAYSPDTSTALYVEYRYSEPELFYVREHILLTNAPVTITDSSYEIFLDSALLIATGFTYSGSVTRFRKGGEQYTEYVSSTGAFEARSNFRIRFPKNYPNLSAEDNRKSESVAVYPNPAHGLLTVSAPGEVSEVTIFDMLGREVLSRRISVTEEIDVSKLDPAIYLMRIGNSIRKIVIK